MAAEAVSIVFRVTMCCIVFSFFVFVPFKTRFRFSYGKTALLAALLTAITAAVTILFLTSGMFFYRCSTVGILLWLTCAMALFRLAVRGSTYEVLFIVLIVLNLYVNIVAIAKVIEGLIIFPVSPAVEQTLLIMLVLAAYLPLLWILMVRLYRQVIEFNMNLPFWKYIWLIPALTYMIFFVKIIGDYWKHHVELRAADVVFIILWSFASYAFYYVTLQMLIQAYKGVSAMQQAEFAASQLDMQREQYVTLLDNIEKTARLKHDWRHHLRIMQGLAENENGGLDQLKGYLQELIPEYGSGEEPSVCRNHIADVILRHYASLAKNRGITMNMQAEISEKLTVSDIDLCVVLGNLAENAVEACEAMNEGSCPEKRIIFRAGMKGRQLVITIKNTYGNRVIRREQRFYSTKHDGAGIGLDSVKKVTEKYGGQMKVEYDETYFTVSILLQNA